MKKAVSAPCATGLGLSGFMWMGVALGWDDLVVNALFLAGLFCWGLTFGGLVYSFKKEVIDGEGGEQQ